MKPNKDKTALPEDVQVLSKLYQFQDFQYHDISREEKLSGLLEKWPLLRELWILSKDKP